MFYILFIYLFTKKIYRIRKSSAQGWKSPPHIDRFVWRGSLVMLVGRTLIINIKRMKRWYRGTMCKKGFLKTKSSVCRRVEFWGAF